ncbi:aldo/keto reductase [Sphaerisporangium sp. NPDC049003]|uniref:aldo/keto reductase n=1 Tax=Sphaerisporangium sp. NPDC049003 TaxID=3364517 RepID=UPI00372313B2
MSLLGWGTYRVPEISAAAKEMIAGGCDWIDTAPNYDNGHAHSALAGVLADHPQTRVSTKVGFLTRATAAAAMEHGVITQADAQAGHSLAPDYLRWQIDRSRTELGQQRLGLVFVHNPERAGGEVGALLAGAFEVLEEATRDRRIGRYGVATWNGFNGVFTVADLLALAEQAAGHSPHHLHALQMPVSLVHLDPIAQALGGRGPLIEAAEHGLAVFASAPLSGGDLPSMVSPELAALAGSGLTPAQAALAVVAAAPGVDRVLLSTSQRAHWDQAAAVCAREPLDEPTLRKIVDVLT